MKHLLKIVWFIWDEIIQENTDYWILEEQFQSFLTNLADHPVINMYGDYWVEMSPEFATGGIRTIKGYYK